MFKVLKYCSIPLLLLLVCCSTVIETTKIQEVPKQETTRRGFDNTTIENDKYPCVVSLHNITSFVGSGILIDPSFVLTAGHCIDNDDIVEIKLFNGECHSVKKLIHHPYYSIGPYVLNDIGLIELETPVVDVKIYKLHPDLLEMSKFQDIDVCGYGGSWKKQSQIGKFRFYGILVEEPNEFKILPIDGSVWFGDSGGGVFSTYKDETYITGIIRSFSVYPSDNGIIIVENSCVRVDRYKEWISSIVKSINTIDDNSRN